MYFCFCLWFCTVISERIYQASTADQICALNTYSSSYGHLAKYLVSAYCRDSIWIASSRKLPSSICKMCILITSCTCATPHPGISPPLKHFKVSNVRIAVVLIRLRQSGSSLSACAQRHVFTWRGPFLFTDHHENIPSKTYSLKHKQLIVIIIYTHIQVKNVNRLMG